MTIIIVVVIRRMGTFNGLLTLFSEQNNELIKHRPVFITINGLTHSRSLSSQTSTSTRHEHTKNNLMKAHLMGGGGGGRS